MLEAFELRKGRCMLPATLVDDAPVSRSPGASRAMLGRRLRLFPAAFAVTLAVMTAVVASQDSRLPVNDEYRYLGTAYQLASHGVFAPYDAGGARTAPFMAEAPLGPFVIAGMIRLDGDFKETLDCFLSALHSGQRDVSSCAPDYGLAIPVQTFLLTMAASLVWLIAQYCGATPAVRSLALGLALISGQYFYFARHFLTDTYILLFVSIFIFGLTRAYRVDRAPNDRTLSLAVAGAGLGLCALTREGYTVLCWAVPLALFLGHSWAARREPIGPRLASAIRPTLSLAIACVIIVSPWLARNVILFDSLAIVDGHGAHVIIERVSYNAMTWREWAAAWFFWLPDFGDKLGPALFGAESVERLRWFGNGSFYTVGNGPLSTELKAEAAAAGEPVLPYVLKTYVFGDLLNHVRVTLVLAWRGLWIGNYFGLFGHALAVLGAWCLYRSGRLPVLLCIALPAAFMTCLHAFVSVSIPRYNLVQLPYLAALSAIVMAHLGARARIRFGS